LGLSAPVPDGQVGSDCPGAYAAEAERATKPEKSRVELELSVRAPTRRTKPRAEFFFYARWVRFGKFHQWNHASDRCSQRLGGDS
jgi:hypothetical protein